MKMPVQAAPAMRGSAAMASAGVTPSGHNTQCCGSGKDKVCMEKYCFFGASSKGCKNGQPYINCIG